MSPQERRDANAVGRQIGYFCHLRLSDRHIGAILVTNQIGVPLEFKYTEPVTTTRLQKILYGAVLDRYLHETVLRERLSQEIRSPADLYITPYEEKEFLAPLAGAEMIALQRFVSPPGEGSGPFTRIREREALIELEDGPTLRVVFSTADEGVQHRLATTLQEVGRTMDVVEPLDRMSAALKTLCTEERKS